MKPLRWFYGLYLLTFGVTVVIGFLAVDYVRWPMFALGVLVAVFVACLVTNLLGFATETASKAGRASGRPLHWLLCRSFEPLACSSCSSASRSPLRLCSSTTYRCR